MLSTVFFYFLFLCFTFGFCLPDINLHHVCLCISGLHEQAGGVIKMLGLYGLGYELVR